MRMREAFSSDFTEIRVAGIPILFPDLGSVLHPAGELHLTKTSV